MSQQTTKKCLRCGTELKEEDGEYLCNPCFNAEMKADIEASKKAKEEEEEPYSDDWRFRDSRGRSVFKR
jgi:uncharacterized Zn finger protein (UPF0148 family)